MDLKFDDFWPCSLLLWTLTFYIVFMYNVHRYLVHTYQNTYAVCTMYILDRHTYKFEKMVHAQYYILYKSSQVCKMCPCTTFFRENDYSTAIGFAVCAWLAMVLACRRRHAGDAAAALTPRSFLTHLLPRRSQWRMHSRTGVSSLVLKQDWRFQGWVPHG